LQDIQCFYPALHASEFEKQACQALQCSGIFIYLYVIQA
jgi:hypothetical protein